MRLSRGNHDHIALGEMMSLAALDIGASRLQRIGGRHVLRLAACDDEYGKSDDVLQLFHGRSPFRIRNARHYSPFSWLTFRGIARPTSKSQRDTSLGTV